MNACPECGAELPTDAPLGMCPKCLAKVAQPSDAPSNPSSPAKTIAIDASALVDVSPTISYFGDYELIQEIARGGMGVVYKARQVSLNRTVALKTILSGRFAGDAEIKRFHTEAEAVAQLSHPNIVPIYEIGEHEGRHYFSMKFVEGGSLAGRIADFKLQNSDLREAARLMVTVARAMHYAHQHGILHRDLKPENILLDADGEPHITDFGLAKRVDSASDMTISGAVMGTPHYMAPEQAAGKTKQVTTATDIYSLGAILYQLLTCHPPFEAESPLEVMRKAVEEESQRPSVINGKIDRDLETICLKCLEKDPSRRYNSAQALSDDLDRWLNHEPITPRPSKGWERTVKWVQRKPLIAGLIGTVSLAVILGMGGTIWQSRRATANAKQSQQRLVRMNIINGSRLMEEGDFMGALPWLVNALQQDPNGPLRSRANVTRIEAALEECPKLAALWTEQLGVDSLDFSRDGRFIVTGHNGWIGGTENYVANVHDPYTGERASAAFRQMTGANRVRFSADGRKFLTLSSEEDRTCTVWDTRSGALLGPPIKSLTAIIDASFSPKGTIIATGNQKGEVQLWNAITHENLFPPMTHKQRVVSVEFDRSGDLLLTASWDGTAQLWNPAKGLPAAPPAIHSGSLRSAEFSADGRRFVSCTYDGFAQVWDATDSTPVTKPLRRSATVVSATLSPDGTRLLTTGADRTVMIWDAMSGAPIGEPMVHPGDVNDACFSPDARWVATACDDQAARIWDAATGRLHFPPIRQPVRRVRFHPTGNLLLTAGGGVVRLWDVSKQRAQVVIIRLPDKISGVSFNPEG